MDDHDPDKWKNTLYSTTLDNQQMNLKLTYLTLYYQDNQLMETDLLFVEWAYPNWLQ